MTLEELYTKYGDQMRTRYPTYNDSMNMKERITTGAPIYRDIINDKEATTPEQVRQYYWNLHDMRTNPQRQQEIRGLYNQYPDMFHTDPGLKKYLGWIGRGRT